MDPATQRDQPAGQGTRPWRRRWVKIVIVVALIVLACVVIEQSVRADEQPKAVSSTPGAAPSSAHIGSPTARGAQQGDVAAPFSVATLSGSTFAVPDW